jgi:NAD(P)-dependent dehydrogenase (short-subunit alcohol dehydrogenase family)
MATDATPTTLDVTRNEQLDGKRAVVVGASRGLGRGIAEALAGAGASVRALARDAAGLADLETAKPTVKVTVADALDPDLPAEVIGSDDPDILAIVAGVSPPMRPIQEHTWETFSRAWDVDVHLTFNWLRQALVQPLRPGSRVLVMSSGAAVAGSPLSGGYAGAKATIRFMAQYAGLGIRVVTVLPKLTPATELGLAAVRRYAQRAGISEEQYSARFGAPVTPERAGAAFLALAAGELDDTVAYLLTGDDGLIALNR